MSATRRFIVGVHAFALALGALTTLSGCGSSSPTTPSPVCAYVLTSDTESFENEGGTGSVGVTTDSHCAWTVEGAADWMTVSPASGTGPGTVTYTVLPNMGAEGREKTLTVATHAYTISQRGREACAYSISPEEQRLSNEGGTATVQVTTGPTCVWSATRTVQWMTVTSGASGRGPGTVTYEAAPNNSSEARTGLLNVATRTVTVKQDGEGTSQPADCRYSVTPVQFEPCMPGTRLTATIDTQPRCQWTAAAGSEWLKVESGSHRTGPGTIAIDVPDNYDAPRDGVVVVRWSTPTAGQNIRIEQAGCFYSVTQASFTMGAAGGTAHFDVIQQSVPNTCGGPMQDRCVWSAKSSASWITITGGMPRTGDNPVAFSVSANTGAARSGRIIVRDRVVTVTQAAP